MAVSDSLVLSKEHLVSLAGLVSKHDKDQRLEVSVKPIGQYDGRYYLQMEQDIMNHRVQYLATGWNADHNIPILLFNLYDKNNNIVSDINIIEEVILRKIDGVWPVVSQEESPVTGLPIWSVHPCQTNQFIQDLNNMASSTAVNDTEQSQVVKEDVYYLYVWLQTFGKFVSLRLPYVTLRC